MNFWHESDLSLVHSPEDRLLHCWAGMFTYVNGLVGSIYGHDSFSQYGLYKVASTNNNDCPV